jgi:hypothetical protein
MSIKKVKAQQPAVIPPATQTAKTAPAAAPKATPAVSDFKSGAVKSTPSSTTTPVVQSGNVGWSDSVPVASSLRFDAHHPDVQAFANAQGWNLPGQKVNVVKADLVYTTDNWKTTHSVPIQYLFNNYQGFVLRDVPKGTQIQYAIHAQVGVSHDGFYSYDDVKDTWFNNHGWNYQSNTGDVTGN